MSARRIGLLGLVGVCVLPASAEAGRSRLYAVSLSGTMRTELTRESPLSRPDGCQGEGRRTERFLASARMVPRPRPAPLGFGTARIDFTARLASRTASAEESTSGSFTQVPGDVPCTSPRSALRRRAASLLPPPTPTGSGSRSMPSSPRSCSASGNSES